MAGGDVGHHLAVKKHGHILHCPAALSHACLPPSRATGYVTTVGAPDASTYAERGGARGRHEAQPLRDDLEDRGEARRKPRQDGRRTVSVQHLCARAAELQLTGREVPSAWEMLRGLIRGCSRSSNSFSSQHSSDALAGCLPS